MEELLIGYLDKPVLLKDHAVIQVSGYDMDFFEYLADQWQVLIYRSHKNPVITKVIIVKDKAEFNCTLANDNIQVSHFLEYYVAQAKLSNKQLGLAMGKLEEISYYLRTQARFYQIDRPENIRLVNILPQELNQALKDYALLIQLRQKHMNSTVVKLFIELNIDVKAEYDFYMN